MEIRAIKTPLQAFLNATKLNRMETDDIDLIKLHVARIGKERSTALPARCYSDPARSFEYPAEIARQEKAKKAKRNKGK